MKDSPGMLEIAVYQKTMTSKKSQKIDFTNINMEEPMPHCQILKTYKRVKIMANV